MSEESSEKNHNPEVIKKELPGDLRNAVFSRQAAFKTYKLGGITKEAFLDKLRTTETCKQYFERKLREYSKDLPGKSPSYDAVADLKIQFEGVDPDLIKQFDAKVLELRELAKEDFNEEKFQEKLNEAYALVKE